MGNYLTAERRQNAGKEPPPPRAKATAQTSATPPAFESSTSAAVAVADTLSGAVGGDDFWNTEPPKPYTEPAPKAATHNEPAAAAPPSTPMQAPAESNWRQSFEPRLDS